MNGIIYCRVSSKEQVQGTSLDMQEKACLEYAKDKGIQVFKKFIEEGESAKFKERTQLLKLLEFCQANKGKVDALIVWKVDRLARNASDHFGIKVLLTKYGVSIHSVTEPIGDDPQGHLMETVLAGFAQFDNDIRTIRTIGGMQKRIEEGIWPWVPPTGYKASRDRTERKIDIPDEKRFKLVKKLWKEYLKGIYSITDIAKMANQWKLTTKKGHTMYPQTIKKMFNNKFYAGILINPWTKEEIEGKHQSMVNMEEFMKAQLIMRGRSVNSGSRNGQNPEFPLRHFVICGYCGKPLTASWSRGRNKRYPYYHCHNRECSHYAKAIHKVKIEKDFIKFLKKITPKENYIKLFKQIVLDVWQEKYKDLNQDNLLYKKELEKLEKEKEKIIEMKKKELFTDEEFLKEKESINEKIAVTRLSMNESIIEEFDIKSALDYALEFIKNIPRLWFDMNLEQKQRFQNLIFPQRVTYKAGKFGTAEISLIYQLIEQSTHQKVGLVPLRGIEPRFTG